MIDAKILSRVPGRRTLLVALGLTGAVWAALVSAQPIPGDYRKTVTSEELAASMTLDEVFARVESSNLDIQIQREQILERLANVRSVRADILPTVDLDLSQTRDQTAAVGRFSQFARGAENRFDGVLRARYEILDPVDFAEWKLARYDRDLAQIDGEEIAQDILLLAGNAYFTHLRNLARVEVIDANLERDEVLLDLARSQFEAGTATRIDVTRAEVQLANDRRARLQQQTVVLQSALDLKVILDIATDREFQFPGLAEMTFGAPPSAGETPLETILANRPDARRADRELERSEIAVDAAQYERLPVIALDASYGFASETVTDGDYDDRWGIGITLTVPVFDAFRISSNVQRARAFKRIEELQSRNLRNEISAEYRLAVQDATSRFEQIGIARQAVDLSREELDLAQTRFRRGVADNSDVVEAQANLAQAEDDLVDAYFQYNLSRLQLARTRGEVRLVLNE